MSVDPVEADADHVGPDEDEALKSLIEQMWSSTAGEYDQRWGHGLRTDVERTAWLALLESLFPPEQRLDIVDIGCGTGFLSLLLAELGHRVVGLDLSEGMLEVHRREAEAKGLDIDLVQGDAEDPPPGLGPFDAVVSKHLLWTLLRPQRAVRAWAALAAPGGRVAAIDVVGMVPATARARISVGCGLAIHSLSESSEPTATSLWRALRSVVLPGDPHYPAELTGRMPLQAARDLSPVTNIWQRAGLEEIMAEELIWLDDVERSQMPLAKRLLRHATRRYLIEGRRPGRSAAK